VGVLTQEVEKSDLRVIFGDALRDPKIVNYPS